MNKPYSKAELLSLIKEVMGIETITPMITKQINRFVMENNMSYKEIARCIVWYTEVKGMKFDIIYGLGIIPSIREEVEKYFKQLELDQQRQKEQAEKIANYQDNNIIFNIKSLKHEPRKPKRFFNIGEIEIKETNDK